MERTREQLERDLAAAKERYHKTHGALAKQAAARDVKLLRADLKRVSK
jgi:hypothetical protein